MKTVIILNSFLPQTLAAQSEKTVPGFKKKVKSSSQFWLPAMPFEIKAPAYWKIKEEKIAWMDSIIFNDWFFHKFVHIT